MGDEAGTDFFRQTVLKREIKIANSGFESIKLSNSSGMQTDFPQLPFCSV